MIKTQCSSQQSQNGQEKLGAVCNMGELGAVWGLQCAVCNVGMCNCAMCLVCSVQCAVCSVQCGEKLGAECSVGRQ